MSRPYVCTKCLTEWDTALPCASEACPGGGHVILIEVLEEHMGKDWREQIRQKLLKARRLAPRPGTPKKKHDLPPAPKHLTTRSFIGKKVGLVPLQQSTVTWAKRNKGKKNPDWSVVTLLKWEAEYMTVRAGNGKRKTFGPQEATWVEIRTTDMIVEDTIRLVTGVIADYVQSRAPRLLDIGPARMVADEIRNRAWQGQTRSEAREFEKSLPKDREAFFPNG